MKIGVIIFLIYAAALLTLILFYERPRKGGPKVTGRGGDFE